MLNELKKELSGFRDPQKARILQRFFKTKKGEYGEGDIFWGIGVPVQRRLAKKYRGLELKALQKLLASKVHEERLVALLILVAKYQKAKVEEKEELVDYYLKNTRFVNNWDLVDLSSHHILGDWLLDKDKKILEKLACSESLWERRIAIISTFAFIRKNLFEETFRIVRILLKDKNDLIHKAVGWMLREVGKRNQGLEEAFLEKYLSRMPRTALRYAIEKFDEEKRQRFLKGQ